VGNSWAQNGKSQPIAGKRTAGLDDFLERVSPLALVLLLQQ